MTKTITARANRSFATIQKGDVITVPEDNARLQAFLASGYLTEVTGEDAKDAKKMDSLDDAEPQVVWDGTPGNRRGKTVQDTGTTEDHADEKPRSNGAKTKGSNESG